MTETYTELKNYLEIIEKCADEAHSQSDFKKLLYARGFDPAVFRRVSDKRTLMRMSDEERKDIAARVKRIDHICRMKNMKVPSYTGWEKFMLACVGLGLVAYVGGVVIMLTDKNRSWKEKAGTLAGHAVDAGIWGAMLHHW